MSNLAKARQKAHLLANVAKSDRLIWQDGDTYYVTAVGALRPVGGARVIERIEFVGVKRKPLVPKLPFMGISVRRRPKPKT